MNPQDIGRMIDDCIDQQDYLTEWELKFVDDISISFANKGDLTHKQRSKLVNIWQRVTQ